MMFGFCCCGATTTTEWEVASNGWASFFFQLPIRLPRTENRGTFDRGIQSVGYFEGSDQYHLSAWVLWQYSFVHPQFISGTATVRATFEAGTYTWRLHAVKPRANGLLPGATFQVPGDTTGVTVDWTFTIAGTVGTNVGEQTLTPPNLTALFNSITGHPNYDSAAPTPLAFYIEPVSHSTHPVPDDFGRVRSIASTKPTIIYTGTSAG